MTGKSWYEWKKHLRWLHFEHHTLTVVSAIIMVINLRSTLVCEEATKAVTGDDIDFAGSGSLCSII